MSYRMQLRMPECVGRLITRQSLESLIHSLRALKGVRPSHMGAPTGLRRLALLERRP